MMAHTLARNGSNDKYREHLGAKQAPTEYSMDNYLPDGEKSRRLSWRAAISVLGFLLGMSVLASRYAVLHIEMLQLWLESSTLVCTLFLSIPAVLSSAAYYVCCSAIEEKYDARPREEAPRWKIQYSKFLPLSKRQEEVILGCLNAAIGGFLASALVMARLLLGYTRIYLDLEEYGVMWFSASFIVLFFYIELWAYGFHRCLHHQWFYGHFHKVHHRYQPPTAFSAIAIHPLEFVAFVLGGQWVFWIVPIHPIVGATVGMYTVYYLIDDHSGVRLTPIWPWQPTSKYHDDHHQHFNCNFGQHIMLFDQLFGTLRPQPPWAESVIVCRAVVPMTSHGLHKLSLKPCTQRSGRTCGSRRAWRAGARVCLYATLSLPMCRSTLTRGVGGRFYAHLNRKINRRHCHWVSGHSSRRADKNQLTV